MRNVKNYTIIPLSEYGSPRNTYCMKKFNIKSKQSPKKKKEVSSLTNQALEVGPKKAIKHLNTFTLGHGLIGP